MTAKQPLQNLLAAYLSTWGKPWLHYQGQEIETEQDTIRLFQSFLAEQENPFSRACEPGHFTGSALVVDKDLEHVLLTHHKKLNKWLQLGGHADGETDLAKVALQEVREESGLRAIEFFKFKPQSGFPSEGTIPFDLDCHVIPARKSEPQHNHYDIRFLIVAQSRDGVVISDESHDVRWFTLSDARRVTDEWSMHRQFNKLEALRR